MQQLPVLWPNNPCQVFPIYDHTATLPFQCPFLARSFPLVLFCLLLVLFLASHEKTTDGRRKETIKTLPSPKNRTEGFRYRQYKYLFRNIPHRCPGRLMDLLFYCNRSIPSVRFGLRGGCTRGGCVVLLMPTAPIDKYAN